LGVPVYDHVPSLRAAGDEIARHLLQVIEVDRLLEE
jgi:hypothetical protein